MYARKQDVHLCTLQLNFPLTHLHFYKNPKDAGIYLNWQAERSLDRSWSLCGGCRAPEQTIYVFLLKASWAEGGSFQKHAVNLG